MYSWKDFFDAAPRYKYSRTLGRGGMSIVFLAEDQDLNTEVAVKVLFSRADQFDTDDTLARLKLEAQINRKIRHPNVARIFDIGQAGEFWFLTMEYIPGQDLSKILADRGSIPARELVPIMRQVALGVGAAHNLGFIHRDLKPSNIMIDTNGAAAVLDFGVARSVTGSGRTGPGIVLGTPAFLSPEQATGQVLDARSDVFSLGTVTYAAVTGKLPFWADKPLATAMAVATQPPPLEPLERCGAPQELIALILRCLEKEPSKRFADANELETGLALVPFKKEAPLPPELDESRLMSIFEERSEEALLDTTTLPTRTPCILVVDDDPLTRSLLKHHLETAGCLVLEAEDGIAALEAVQHGPDLILMDIRMPRMDGLDATRIIKTTPVGATLPVVIMSVIRDRSRLAFALQCGATDFIPKPLDITRTLATISDLLAHKGLRLSA
ncbi:MAG: protein kinase [Thermoanaerobaculia bacterium]|nr:Serine/threonine-protein kinase PknD [Thermoanaerobaculia bacterium]MCK6685813.1 protein kinase [Thermoanaerobaculia bacterium]